MKLAILQLSDIHFGEGPNPPALQRVDAMTDAALAWLGELGPADGCFLLLSGDISNTGGEAEFEVAEEFVERLVARVCPGLGLRRGKTFFVAPLPGNHDCELGSSMRATVVKHVKADRSLALDQEHLECCLSAQRAFLQFRDRVGPGWVSSEPAPASALAYEYSIEAKGDVAMMRCLNTAWLSTREERQGGLFFPAAVVQPVPEGVDFVGTAFHHPFQWFGPIDARSFSQVVQTSSDFIFTGHEHVGGERSQVTASRVSNVFVEGAVLQTARAPHVSAFNALMVDTETENYCLSEMTWSPRERSYSAVAPSGWRKFARPRAIERGLFLLGQRMESFLNETGINLTAKDGTPLRAMDLYVDPILKREAGRLRGSELLQADEACWLILGDDHAGKSTLGKRLFVDALDVDLVPIFINPRTLDGHSKRAAQHFERAFKLEYSRQLWPSFRSLGRDREI